MDELVARAVDLHAADTGAEDDVAAATLEELSIPTRYLREARTSLADEARVAAARRRRLKVWLLAALGLGAVAVFALQLWNPIAFFAWSSEVDRRSDWRVVSNAESTAIFESGPQRPGRVVVHSFGVPSDGRYYANIRHDEPPRTLRGRSTMHVEVRGSGLSAARVYVERGRDERWRSPEIAITPEWQTLSVPVRSFERQVGGRGRWEGARWAEPTRLSRIQIKLGYFINPPDASGWIQFGEIRFE